jgi:hypothetical protein
MAINEPIIGRGKRVLLAGRTGSGKSTLGCWLMTRSPGSWVILNPKWTKAYDQLPDSQTVKSLDFGKIERSIAQNRFTVVNPKPGESNNHTLDAFVAQLHDSYSNIGLCCDELYTLHSGGVAGEGLLGWLTRGRELKQSFIGMTQRPKFISKFLFSESDFVGGMTLSIADDRKVMYQNTGNPAFLQKVPERDWLWLDVATDELRFFGPVPKS